MKRNKFTLLEVLVALVILTLGIAGLLWQLSIAANRAARNAETWELTHDLTSAAEYLLLHGPEAGLNETLFSGEFEIASRYEDPRLPADTETRFGQKRLRTLVVEASREGEVLDSLRLDCWVKERSDGR